MVPAACVAAAAVLAAAWYAHLLLARDAGLATFGYDQAFFQQLVWNLDHGHGFVSSFDPGSFLGLHFSPLLAAPAAVELLWPDPRALSLLAAVTVAALGPSAFLLLRAMGVRAGLAAALAAPLPLWPAAQEAVRAGFHPETMGIVLALLAGATGLRGRPVLAAGLALAALAAKEDQAWNVLAIGMVLAASGPAARRLGIGLAATAVAWGAVITGIVMPLLRAGRTVDTDSYYRWLHSATATGVLHALTLPRGWLAAGVMVACAGCLPVLRPAWLALALPPLAADLLSMHAPQAALGLQYGLPLVVPVLVAAGLAAARPPRWLAGLPAAAIAGPAIVLALAAGSLPPAAGAAGEPFGHPTALAALDRCVAAIPPRAPVAADDPLTVRLASRPAVRELTAARLGDYVLIDRRASLPGYVTPLARAASLGSISSESRPVLCDDGRFLALGPALAPAAKTTPTASPVATSAQVHTARGQLSSATSLMRPVRQRRCLRPDFVSAGGFGFTGSVLS